MKEYKIFDTGAYQFVCCSYKKYEEYASNLTEENKEKCCKIYNSLKEISPGILDGKDLTEKIEEIQNSQGFNLGVKSKNKYGILYTEVQGSDNKIKSVEFAHLELAYPIEDKI